MKTFSCELQYSHDFQDISSDKNFHPAYIANCFFNGFLCYNVVMFNVVAIRGIMRTSSLPKSLKTLLLSLAVSDVGVGLLVQPLYISLLVNVLRGYYPSCNTYKVFGVMTILFPTASFLGVVAVSVDRFLAIQFHLRYQELVTHKRVVAVVIAIWMLSASLSSMTLWGLDYMKYIIVCLGGAVGLFLISMAYLKIYLVVRRHKNQIQALQVHQVAQTREMQNFASLTKSALGIFYVYILFWICYLPFFIFMAAKRAANSQSIDLTRCYMLSYSLVLLNSSLNPVIYCWKLRHVRHAVIDILWNMSWFRNCKSQ